MIKKAVSNEQILDVVLTMNAAVSNLFQNVNDLKIQLIKVEERLTKVEQRLTSVEQRLDKVEQRLDKVEHRLDKMDERLEIVEAQTTLIPGISEAIMNFTTTIDDHDAQLKALRKATV